MSELTVLWPRFSAYQDHRIYQGQTEIRTWKIRKTVRSECFTPRSLSRFLIAHLSNHWLILYSLYIAKFSLVTCDYFFTLENGKDVLFGKFYVSNGKSVTVTWNLSLTKRQTVSCVVCYKSPVTINILLRSSVLMHAYAQLCWRDCHGDKFSFENPRRNSYVSYIFIQYSKSILCKSIISGKSCACHEVLPWDARASWTSPLLPGARENISGYNLLSVRF